MLKPFLPSQHCPSTFTLMKLSMKLLMKRLQHLHPKQVCTNSDAHTKSELNTLLKAQPSKNKQRRLLHEQQFKITDTPPHMQKHKHTQSSLQACYKLKSLCHRVENWSFIVWKFMVFLFC